MIPVQDTSSTEAWLQWFEEYKYTRCRASLCAKYDLEPADADVLINTARMQVFLHWDTLQSPLAYFWTILRREVSKHLHHCKQEQRGQEAYALERRFYAIIEACTSHQVADILELAKPHQRQLLSWFAHGYDDAQVATRLGSTPHAVRQARYETYIDLRTRYATDPI